LNARTEIVFDSVMGVGPAARSEDVYTWSVNPYSSIATPPLGWLMARRLMGGPPKYQPCRRPQAPSERIS